MRATSQVLNSHMCRVTATLDSVDRKHSHDHRKFRWGEPSLVEVAQQSQGEHFRVQKCAGHWDFLLGQFQ